MATGYATFANGGCRIQPHFIKRIEMHPGKVIYETPGIRLYPLYCGTKCLCNSRCYSRADVVNETPMKL